MLTNLGTTALPLADVIILTGDTAPAPDNTAQIVVSNEPTVLVADARIHALFTPGVIVSGKAEKPSTALVTDTSKPVDGVMIIVPFNATPFTEKVSAAVCGVPYVLNKADDNVSGHNVGGLIRVPSNLISSRRNEVPLFLLNFKYKLDEDGIVAELDFKVHVLALIVVFTLNALKVEPLVLYSTVSILLAVDDSTPKLTLILVYSAVLMPDIIISLALPPATPKKILPAPLAPA